jgi:hypothetical protein
VQRLFNQLVLVPWLRVLAWTYGFTLGLENFWMLALNRVRFNVSLETLGPDFLGILAEGRFGAGAFRR